MAVKYEGSFLSETDGLKISVLCLMPEDVSKCRGVVQLVHGMSEHKERYIPFMEYLVTQGYIPIIHDHRGHGKSVRYKSDLGYMYEGGADAIVGDIMTINQEIKKHFPNLPVILLGHSMGALAVRAFAAEHDDCIDMLIISGSPSESKARLLGKMIAEIESNIFDAKHKSKILELLSFGPYAMKFANEKNKNAWLCSDSDVYKKYSESELCGFTFTDDGYKTLFELMKRAYDIHHWKCTNSRMPVLFISGALDPCLGNVSKFASSVHAMRRAGYLDVKGKLYPDMRHEILNEKDKAKVWRDVTVYMRKKGF